MSLIYTNVAKTTKEKKAAAINCLVKSSRAHKQHAAVFENMSARVALVKKAFYALYATNHNQKYVTYRANTTAKNPFVALKIVNPNSAARNVKFKRIRDQRDQFKLLLKQHNCEKIDLPNTNSIIVRVMSKPTA